MSRKKRLMIAGGIAALLVAVIGVAVVQAADPAPAAVTKNPVIARVAEILGIEQSALEGAFAQAQKEQRDAALDTRLQKLVTDGVITQAQADQYKEWWASRPDVPVGAGIPKLRGAMPRGGMMQGRGFQPGFRQGMQFPGRPGLAPPPITQTPPVTQ